MSDTITNLIDDAPIEDKERFLNQLKFFDGIEYYYQKDMMIRYNYPWRSPSLLRVLDSNTCSYNKYDKKGLPLIHGLDFADVKHFTYTELMSMTDFFSKSNYIGRITFARLYRGKIEKKDSGYMDVIVKIWDFSFPPRQSMSRHPARLQNELRLLTDPKIKSHPNVAQLIGFHCERTLAVVYKGGSLCMNRLEDIIRFDKFCWNNRMKVVTAVGSVLRTFHENNHVQSCVNSQNILVDEAHNPMIINFISHGCSASIWGGRADVADFALLLFDLIMKETIDDRMFGEWILSEKLDVPNSFGIDKNILCSVKELSAKYFKEGRYSGEKTTIVRFLDELNILVQKTSPENDVTS